MNTQKPTNQPYMKSNVTGHIVSTGHNYKNIQTNLQMLQKIQRGKKFNTLMKFKTCRHPKSHRSKTVNEQIREEEVLDFLIGFQLCKP